MFSVFQTMLEAEYKRGFEAGIQQQKNEQLEDANRRAEYLFDQGKKLGYDKGSFDGFSKGYHVGYDDGEIKGKYGNIEEIDLDDLIEQTAHGEWKYNTDTSWYCSECNNYTDVKTNFCDHCGADMRPTTGSMRVKRSVVGKASEEATV